MDGRKRPPSSPAITVVNDNTPPYVLSIDRSDATPTKAATVHWDVTFSESVTGVGTGDFNLGAAARRRLDHGRERQRDSYTVTVATGTSGTLGST